MEKRGNVNRSIWGWALYDWANSAFATTVIAGFFPMFFKEYWASSIPASESTFYLGLSNAIASLIIVILAPLLGAIADSAGHRKRFLLLFALMGICTVSGFYFITKGEWQIALILYVLSVIGHSGSLVFYDALIIEITRASQIDKVSALGYALGYLGGGVLFSLNVAMTLWPEIFGLEDRTEAVKFSFIMVACWWALFSIPLILWVHESAKGGRPGTIRVVGEGIKQLWDTFGKVRQLRIVLYFLIGYWCYIDAVGTVVRMAVDYGLALGFPSESLIVALLITQFIGFPSAVAFGHLGARFGPKVGIYIAIGVYVLIILWASRMQSVTEFYGLAIGTGLVQGGIQSLSRSLYARIIPSDKSGEFFGFYNMMGKFAAIFGPLMVGVISLVTGDPRLSILSLLVLFTLGFWFLWRVDISEGEAMARRL